MCCPREWRKLRERLLHLAHIRQSFRCKCKPPRSSPTRLRGILFRYQCRLRPFHVKGILLMLSLAINSCKKNANANYLPLKEFPPPLNRPCKIQNKQSQTPTTMEIIAFCFHLQFQITPAAAIIAWHNRLQFSTITTARNNLFYPAVEAFAC